MFQLKNKSTLARNSFKTLTSKPSNNFNDLFKQPIHSYTQNSFINLDIAALTQAKYSLDISWTASLIICSGGLRILLSGSNYLISKLKNKYPDDQGWFGKIRKEWIFNDISNEKAFYKLDKSQIEETKKFYKLDTLVSAGVSGFICVNWLRALHFMCYSPNFFQNFAVEKAFDQFFLCTHDPTFILPLITILLNIYTVSTSKHPFLINFNRKENYIKRFNQIFALSLPAIFSPTAYLISWCSFMVTHLGLRKLNHLYKARQYNKEIKKYAISDKTISEIERFYKKL